MNKHRTISCTALLLAAAAATALHAAPSTKANTGVGTVDLTANSSTAGPGYLIYKTAHMKTENGGTLDSDELRANLAQGTNALINIVATGHVRAHAEQIGAKPDPQRAYTITSDKAVYDPKTNQIDFTDQVTVTITSPMTKGPLVQTAQSAVVQLGKGPSYPTVSMNQVHTVFTPTQPSPSTPAPAP